LSIPSGDVLMNSEIYIASIICFISGLTLGIAVGISLPQAEAHFTDQVTYITNWGTEYVVEEGVTDSHILRHILEEEQKQTALLDHMDCTLFYQSGVSSRYTAEKHCGLPLDYTGVYKP